MIALKLLVSLGLLAPVPRPAPRPAPAVHDIHLSYARVAVEGRVVVCRIRMFRDDLERALSRRAGKPVTLASTAAGDSLFIAYFNEQFALVNGGQRLAGTVVASGEEPDMWWYTVRFEASAPIRSLALRNGVLFDLFDDQRNMTKVMHVPTGKEFAYYFVEGDTKLQVMRFR